ncbi:MAG: hypothetical protein A3H67_03810 [Candidatus Buchananbacteria bacterium RIFCSPLOWO2_02_FULL_46_11b]|uniref:Uncharacterized protein n=2 Tax=Candidatus Buchananiibacteriota TaxID=1817903 RepID=A0A1G1YQZ8_9BACT|nr:MAG: hypothetical protein A3B15_00145 [Candidatus Buchananbacteria bacterium RIFCSPLOWO2_01_FULL_45_31]OGY57317.1 MAG: hypothetical protein A3H67_03810 [Candidatus Buchananbacteria bacterium RIFCSPLOWO2_02_FULL_46_11b]
MKKIFFIAIFIFVFGFALLPNFTFAQGMMGLANLSADKAAGQSQWEGGRLPQYLIKLTIIL